MHPRKLLKKWIWLACLCSGCGVGPPADYTDGGNTVTNYTQCVLPSDQGAGSFKTAWASLPVPIVFDQDFYVANGGQAMDALRAAVNTWNGWAGLRGLVAFTIVNDGSGSSAGQPIPVLSACSQAAYTAAYTPAVGIWKIRSSGDGANARPSCGTSETIMSNFTQGSSDWIVSGNHTIGASILLNFDNFNSPGQSAIDVQSLLLHELGHVLGLLHSCNGTTTVNGITYTDASSSPSCDVAPSQYLNAVMFPTLNPGQLRRSLTQNDYSRVNCLY